MLKNLLHIYRNMEHTKDVVVRVPEATPEDYLDHLREREYPFIRHGEERVDLAAAVRDNPGAGIQHRLHLDARIGPDDPPHRDGAVLNGGMPEYLNIYRSALPGYPYRRESGRSALSLTSFEYSRSGSGDLPSS